MEYLGFSENLKKDFPNHKIKIFEEKEFLVFSIDGKRIETTCDFLPTTIKWPSEFLHDYYNETLYNSIKNEIQYYIDNTNAPEPTGPDLYPDLTPEQSALKSIIEIGYDYDGCNSVKSLKELIDELVQIAKNGLDGKRIRCYAKGEFDKMLAEYKDRKANELHNL